MHRRLQICAALITALFVTMFGVSIALASNDFHVHNTVQLTQALADAGNGDTIYVHPGNYNSFYLMSNPGVTITSAPGQLAQIKGSLIILADGVTVDGLEFSRGYQHYPMIAVGLKDVGGDVLNDVRVINNVVRNTSSSTGISAFSAGENQVISGNIIYDVRQRHGMYIHGTDEATDKIVSHNLVLGPTTGRGYGIHAFTRTGDVNGIRLTDNVFIHQGAELGGNAHVETNQTSFDRNIVIEGAFRLGYHAPYHGTMNGNVVIDSRAEFNVGAGMRATNNLFQWDRFEAWAMGDNTSQGEPPISAELWDYNQYASAPDGIVVQNGRVQRFRNLSDWQQLTGFDANATTATAPDVFAVSSDGRTVVAATACVSSVDTGITGQYTIHNPRSMQQTVAQGISTNGIVPLPCMQPPYALIISWN